MCTAWAATTQGPSPGQAAPGCHLLGHKKLWGPIPARSPNPQGGGKYDSQSTSTQGPCSTLEGKDADKEPQLRSEKAPPGEVIEETHLHGLQSCGTTGF